jgi:hypothetical protein
VAEIKLRFFECFGQKIFGFGDEEMSQRKIAGYCKDCKITIYVHDFTTLAKHENHNLEPEMGFGRND